MKTVGIIAEYNPFHNGHAYQIEQAKKMTGADFCVVIMSGNFVQRGTLSVMDKYLRTEAALRSGADAVLELPVRFATASAEIFALGGVSILHYLNCIDYLCFGSETGKLEPLLQAAHLLYKEPDEYKLSLKKYCKEGNSFPVARKLAVSDYLLSTKTAKNNPDLISCFDSPNDLLGIEYCKALLTLNSRIQPVVVKRMDAGYHAASLPNQEDIIEPKSIQMTSATSLRNALEETAPSSLESFLPAKALPLYEEFYKICFPVQPDDISSLLLYKLRLEQKDGYARYFDVSSDLSNKIKQTLSTCTTFSECCKSIKSKDLTLTRCQRALLHIVLQITSENVRLSLKNTHQTYARLLGFCKSSSSLLRVMSNRSAIPLITKVADAESILSPICMQMFLEDIFAADLYRSLLTQKYQYSLPSEYRKGPVIVTL